MKSFLILALLLFFVSGAFASGPQNVGNAHAVNGYDYKDVAVSVLVNPAESGRVWLNARYSYALLFAERDKLEKLVRTAARKIDTSIANKTTISYVQEVGRFYTENGALISVTFNTDGYGLSKAVVHIMGAGNNDILLLDKQDVQSFIDALGSAHSFVSDYQRQVKLFN